MHEILLALSNLSNIKLLHAKRVVVSYNHINLMKNDCQKISSGKNFAGVKMHQIHYKPLKIHLENNAKSVITDWTFFICQNNFFRMKFISLLE